MTPSIDVAGVSVQRMTGNDRLLIFGVRYIPTTFYVKFIFRAIYCRVIVLYCCVNMML
jgi:hypothetical protein